MNSDEDDDDFDLIETPPVAHSVTVNSNRTRIAVAHSKGLTVYALYGGASVSGERTFAPRIVCRLGYAQLCSDSSDDALQHSDGSASDDGHVPGTRSQAAHRDAGVGIVALLYETNIMAVVGGGATPCQPPNRVLLFNGDYIQQRFHLLGPVAQVVLRNRRVISLAQTTLYIHSFNGDKLLEIPATGWRGTTALGRSSVARLSATALGSTLSHLAAPSSARADSSQNTIRRMPLDLTNCETNPLCAFPDNLQGHVAFCNWLSPAAVSLGIAAHQGDIDALALSENGEGLVTASDTNTVIRVWNTVTGVKIRELRLASQPYTTFIRSLGLYSLMGERPSTNPAAFYPDFAMALDSNGKIKFFFVGPGGGQHESGTEGVSAGVGSWTNVDARNQASRLSSFQFVSSYFASEWHCTYTSVPQLAYALTEEEVQSRSAAVQPVDAIAWLDHALGGPTTTLLAGSQAAATRPVTASNAPQQLVLEVTAVGLAAGVVVQLQFNATTRVSNVVSMCHYDQ